MIGLKDLTKLTAVVAAFGLTVSATSSDAATLSAADIGNSFDVSFLCEAGDDCPDSGNQPNADLSASATFTLDNVMNVGSTTEFSLTVDITNTVLASAAGTNRITAFGFSSDPDAVISNPLNNGDGLDWDVGAGFIPGFNGEVELCVFATNGCQSATGGASNGLQAEDSDTISFVLTTAAIETSITLGDFAIKFASATSTDGSFEFGGSSECEQGQFGPDCGEPTNPIPLPAGLPLMLTIVGIGAYMRKRSRKSA